MLQGVYDNDYAAPAIVAKGWPSRWQPASGSYRGARHRQPIDELKGYAADGKAAEAWLRDTANLCLDGRLERVVSQAAPAGRAGRYLCLSH